jgi:transcriptional regulator with XRE-family HTH domain
MNAISKIIKQERESLNLTQQDVAVLLEVSRITYIKWEQDPGTMPLGKYEKLMSEFNRLHNLKEKE